MSAKLAQGAWGLARARAEARAMEASPAAIRALVKALFGENIELRKRASDVARRITERNTAPLERYADELAGLLTELPVEENRTRWHLGLVVPRIAKTHEQRLRAARLMHLLAQDDSNVVRCSAVEGLGLLALTEPSLLDEAEDMVEHFLSTGTLANRSRATGVRKMLRKRYGSREA